MSANAELVWLPVGKPPKPLWQGEANDLNSFFLTLYKYFEQHEQYSYVYGKYDWQDPIQREFGNLKLSRSVKWLTYYGLLQHVEAKVYSEQDQKKQTIHFLKPTPRGLQTVQHSQLFDIGGKMIGLGEAYGCFNDVHKWLIQQFEANKVAMWRQEKWLPEFNRLYYENLDKTKDEFMNILKKWLGEHLATCPKRGKSFRTIAQFDVANAKITDFQTSKYEIEIEPAKQPGNKYCLYFRKNFGDNYGGVMEFKTKEELLLAVQQIFIDWEQSFNVFRQKEPVKVTEKTLAFRSFTDEITKAELFGNKRLDLLLKGGK